jgi:hypothetical protein
MSLLTRNRAVTQSRSGVDDTATPKKWIVAVALVTLFLGFAVGGFIAKRQAPKAAPAPTVASAPTAPAAISAGPSRFDGFTPVGFQRSEAGAVAAASAYTAMVTELIRRPETEVRAAARRIAVPEAADAVEGALIQPISGIRNALALAAEQNPNGRALLRTIPIGTKLVAYTEQRAQVDVWAMGLTGLEMAPGTAAAGDQTPQAGFTLTSYTLVWERGDWHIADYRYVDGVGPSFTRTLAPSPTQLIDFAAQYAPFRYLGNTEVTR